jgi:hypothetical protein
VIGALPKLSLVVVEEVRTNGGVVFTFVIHGIGLLLAAAKTRAEGFGAGGPDQNLNITNLINLIPLKLSHHPDHKSPCLSSARSSPA